MTSADPTPAPRNTLLSSPGTRALLIGTGRHAAGSPLPDVLAVDATIGDLGRTLVERCGLRPENLLAPVIDPADPLELGKAITRAAKDATDVLLLYYVGHGLVSQANELYLATGVTDDLTEGLAFKALPYTAVRDAISACRARAIVLVLDCCFAGGRGAVSSAAGDPFAITSLGGVYVLTSASRDEQALAPEGEPYTAFSGELLRLLREGDPGLPRELTLETVYKHLRRVLPDRGWPAPQRYLSGRAGDLVLVANAAAVSPPVRPEPGVSSDDAECPYPGLDPFTADNQRFFFGRAALTKELLGRLAVWAPDGPVALVGLSGAGKSSLLRAGLLPAVKRGDLERKLPGSGGWPQAVLTPGEHPLRTLAAHLASAAGRPLDEVLAELDADPSRSGDLVRQGLARLNGGREAPEDRLLLAVDQFEEVFTSCQDEQERQSFIRALSAVGEAAVIILGLRADFYASCLAHPELAEVLKERYFPVTTMTTTQLREAIEGPAKVAGLALEAGLADTLMQDLRADHEFAAGALPLLSYALWLTWGRRDGSLLTLAGYRATGGIWRAVTNKADETYKKLEPAAQDAARIVLLLMVRIGDGTENTRRLLNLKDLLAERPPAETAAITAACEALARARLITVDDDRAQIAHEALLRAWTKLRGWIAGSREALLVQQRLSEAAAAWQQAERDPDGLYRAGQLAGVRVHFTADSQALGQLAQEFYRASEQAEQRRLHAEQRRARTARRLRTSLAVLLALALIALGFAVWQSQIARSESQVSLSRQLAADSAYLIATDPDLASLLAIQAYRTNPSSEAVASLYAAADLPLRRQLIGHTGPVEAVAFSPDGHNIATASADHIARLWDAATGTLRATLTGHTGSVLSLAFSPDGRTLATGGHDGTVRLWATATGTLRTTFANPTGVIGAVQSVAFSPDGRTLAAAGFDHAARLWDVATGALRTTLTGHTGAVQSVAFSPDGRTLATGGADHIARLWDVATGTLRATLTGDTGSVLSVAFSPDGRTLATGGADGSARLWDVATGTGTATLTNPAGHTRAVQSVAFSPDGRTLATGGADGSARLWEVAAGTLRTTLTGHTDGVQSVAFSPDGRTLATGSSDGESDGRVRLWDVATDATRATLAGHTGSVQSVDFSPDGRTLAIADGAARLWDVATGTLRTTLLGPGGAVQSVVYILDGRTVVTGSFNGTAGLWDAATGTLRTTLGDHVGQLAFSPVARTLAIAGGDGTVRLYDVATSTLRRTLGDHVGQLAFSPDGRTLATGSDIDDGRVRLWDVATGTLRTTLTGHSLPVVAVAFSPDGRTLATAGFDHTARLWDVATGTNRTILTRYSAPVDTVAFSPDGRTLATGSEDGSVRLWDVATGTVRTTLTGHTDKVHALAFSPDGRTLATGSHDTTVRLWDVSLPDLPTAITRICQAVHRDLTTQERSTYLSGQSTDPVCPS